MPNTQNVKDKPLIVEGLTNERAEFLADILVTAVEGGMTSAWLGCGSYRWWFPSLDGGKAEHLPGQANAYLRGCQDFEDSDEFYGDCTLAEIEAGIAKVVAGEAKVHTDYVGRVAAASATNDAGLLDAIDADIVLQAGLLGEVVYG